jgi:hypothetical protein
MHKGTLDLGRASCSQLGHCPHHNGHRGPQLSAYLFLHVERDINVDLKIFSLSILLSSVFVYNSLGHIDEKALENMSYVLRVSENMRMRSES